MFYFLRYVTLAVFITLTQFVLTAVPSPVTSQPDASLFSSGVFQNFLAAKRPTGFSSAPGSVLRMTMSIMHYEDFCRLYHWLRKPRSAQVLLCVFTCELINQSFVHSSFARPLFSNQKKKYSVKDEISDTSECFSWTPKSFFYGCD